MKTLPYFQGTGRRKTSIARVRLVPGEGARLGETRFDDWLRQPANTTANQPIVPPPGSRPSPRPTAS